MQVLQTSIPDVKLIEPQIFGDERGFFMESWNREVFGKHGLPTDFVQDNHSRSRQGILRGLHYQIRNPQGKLVRVVQGEVFDVAVDLRRNSATFGRWVGVVLSEENHRQLWVPPGFAHGFYVLSAQADFLYKCTAPYTPDAERTLRWDDPQVGVDWPLVEGRSPLLSKKDQAGVAFDDAEVYES